LQAPGVELPNLTPFPPLALESLKADAGEVMVPFSGSVLEKNPAAKLEYIRYPPIEAKIIANTVRLALEKRDFLKASDFINLLSPRV
jgi:hypothetical protein